MSSCCVVGLGYIGLPTAAVLSKVGYRVYGVDISPKVVETINNGCIHIVEPDLDELVSNSVRSGLLSAHHSPLPADNFIIAVPTPFKKNNNSIPQPNVDYVLDAVRSISLVLKPGNLILLESTSPVGTTDRVADIVQEVSGLTLDQINIAYCPERVLPGRILHELVVNDRVIGGLTTSAAEAGKSFYSSFCTGQILITSARTAELVKLTENSFRDVNIAFANELSMVCDRLRINVRELIDLANHHPRVNILSPGCGVGGHCIAVDPWFIVSANPELTPLIQAARQVNDNKSEWVIQQIRSRASSLESSLGRPPRIGCMGISFKPDVDDLRESPALHIANKLISSGYHVLICEPNLVAHSVLNLSSIDDVIKNSDLLVFLVAHTRFRGLKLAGRQFLDLCGVIEGPVPT
jgi:UDP-N-acetyl-D-mannosaminuronic acid dehydrogenase